jgi:hypothetical protein
MNLPTRYEQFISHFVPGVIGTSGIVLCVERYCIPGTLAYVAAKLDKWQNFAVLSVILISSIMFVGLWIDSIKHWTIEKLFKKLVGRKDDDDTLTHLNALGVEKYMVILNEYYFYYQYAVNGASAMLLLALPLPAYLLQKGLISCGLKFGLFVVFLVVILTLYISGYHYYARFYNAFAKLGSKKS